MSRRYLHQMRNATAAVLDPTPARNFGLWSRIKDTVITAISGTTTWISARLIPVLHDQTKLESTKTYQAYAATRHIVMPLLTKPLPVALTQIVWNVGTYNTLAVVYKYLPARMQTILHLGINAYRFADDQAMAVAHWVGLLLLQQKWVRKSMPDELRALIYVLMREAPTFYRAIQSTTLSPQPSQASSQVALTRNFYRVVNQRFHIRLNGQPLNQTQCIVLLNHHDNKTHTEFATWFIAATGKPGDQVLVEGFESMRPLPCDHLNSVVIRDSKGNLALHANQHNPKISADLACYGLDNIQEMFLSWRRLEYSRLLQEKMQQMSNTVAPRECFGLLNDVLAQSDLDKEDPLRVYVKEICALFPLSNLLMNIMQAITIKNNLDRQMVGAMNRNNAFMETYRKVASAEKRTYLFFGSSHYLPEGAEHSAAPYDAKRSPGDVQHALQKFLDAEQCAILSPK